MRCVLDEIDNKIERRANATDEKPEELSAELKRDFNEFKNTVREWVE